MRTVDELKRAAAAAAVERVEPGMILGLGTGSTISHFLELLADRHDAGALTGIAGIPTSERTAGRARELGIPLTRLEEHPAIDLTVDGADEVDPNLDLIKGLGGALLREKLVAQASRRLLIIVDDSKVVPRLGTRAPLPVEVVPFGWTVQRSFLSLLGARPALRTRPGGSPFETDNHNYILDCHFDGGIPDAAALERRLEERAGIVESGLFLQMASEVVVAGTDGVRRLFRSGSVTV